MLVFLPDVVSCYLTIFLSAVAVFPNVKCRRNQKKRPCVENDEGLFMPLLVKSGRDLYLCSFILQVLLGAENLTQSKYQCSQVPNSRIKTGVASCLLSISSDCCSSHRRPSHPDDRITCVCISQTAIQLLYEFRVIQAWKCRLQSLHNAHMLL